MHENGLGIDVVEHQGPLAEGEGVAAPREVHLAAEDALGRSLNTHASLLRQRNKEVYV